MHSNEPPEAVAEQTGTQRVQRSNKGSPTMLAAFATLAFLSTLWLAVIAVADTLDGSLAKIVAALGGRSLAAQPRPVPIALRVSPRVSARQQRIQRAEPRLRAAA